MEKCEKKEFKLNKLPKQLQPNSLYYIKSGNSNFKIYLTDSGCPPTAYNLTLDSFEKRVTSPDGSINVVETLTETQIQVAISYLKIGDNISQLVNDIGYITSADVLPFDPNEYDLDEFTNTSSDPFTRQSEIINGITNLNYTASPTQGTVISDTGTDAIIPLADLTNAGLLEPADKVKLNSTSGVNTGDETSTTIKIKRPLKTIINKSLEGDGNINIETVDILEVSDKYFQTEQQNLNNDATSSIQLQLNNKQSIIGYTPANDINVLHKTGTESKNGRLYFSDGTVDLSNIDVTSSPSVTSTKPQVLLARTTDAVSDVSEHGFSDVSYFDYNGSNGNAYNSFDSFVTIKGTGNANHFLGFQERTLYESTGTMSLLQGFRSAPEIISGIVNSRYGLRVSDVFLSGTGALVNNYGIIIESLTSGSGLKYSIITQGSTPSLFGGNVTMGGLNVPANSITLSGSSASYFINGLGTPTLINSTIRNQTLGNLPTGVNTPITSASTILQGFVDVQAQINAKVSTTLNSARILVGNGSNVATSVAMSGGATISNAGVITLGNSAVTGQVLSGFVSGPGTVSSSDTVLQAVGKLDGNMPTSGNYTPVLTATTNTTSLVAFTTSSYMRVGNIVTIKTGFTCSFTTVGISSNFTVTLPVNRANGSPLQMGVGSAFTNNAVDNIIPLVLQSNSTNTFSVDYKPLNGTALTGTIIAVYNVLD